MEIIFSDSAVIYQLNSPQTSHHLNPHPLRRPLLKSEPPMILSCQNGLNRLLLITQHRSNPGPLPLLLQLLLQFGFISFSCALLLVGVLGATSPSPHLLLTRLTPLLQFIFQLRSLLEVQLLQLILTQ